MKLKNYAAITHHGPYLEVNEDGHSYDLENMLFMIFDGFGGSGVGDRLVDDLRKDVGTFYTRIGEDRDATLPFFYSHKYLLEGNALINAMLYAHKSAFSENAAKDMSTRGGASGIFAAFSENIVTLASVGNCAVYLYRKGRLEKIMVEDSYRFLGGDNYGSHFQSIPMSAFGLFEELNFQVKEVRPGDGDMLCLLTDGVYSRLDHKEISHVLGSHEYDNTDKIEKLFELANSRGNLDNQTGLLLQF